MKIMRIFGIILLIVIIVIAVIGISLRVNHQIKLKKEAKEFIPPGNIVEVNGKKLHLFLQGEGNLTLVFMAGHGTSSPVLDFKPLWSQFTNDYKIVVLEKSGYGWSEISNSSRDIDAMLEETRQALNLAGEKGPYVLIPHSMSGLEANYWAKKYPDEVMAIIGLDPLTPNAVEIIPKPSNVQLNIMYFISRIGLSRLMPDSEIENTFPLIKANYFNEEDRAQYLASFYKSSFTKDMFNEMKYLEKNSNKVEENGVAFDIPMLYFISKDQETNAIGWGKALTDFLSEVEDSEYIILDTGHYVHYEKSDIIATETKIFLEKVTK